MNRDLPEVDREAVRIARRQGAIEIAIGEALAQLFARDGLIQLGYARQNDYARERLGVPPRTMYAWLELARAVRDRPLLRSAVEAGAVSPRKARAVAPLAVGGGEELWVAAAMQLPERELEAAVRAEGVDPSDAGYGQVECQILRMAPADQDVLDEAIAIAREKEDQEPSRWQCVEIICQEWLGEYGWFLGRPAAPAPQLDPPRRRAVAAQLRAIDVASAPPASSETALELDARIAILLQGRRAYDLAFGAALAELVRRAAWRTAGHDTFEEYCRERLGMSVRSVRSKVWLNRRLGALPELRDALAAGTVTYSKALTIARDATSSNIEARIEEAAVTTCQQLERESTEREDRQNRAHGIRRLWGPADAMGTIAEAIVSARAIAGASGLGALEPGEALALIAAYFITVYREQPKGSASRKRRRVLRRHGGSCAAPGCSRAAQHVHHIEFRSHGGSEEESNLLGLCVVHHLRGIHHGHLAVSGRAGERLEWRFGDGEEWVTSGADDVRVFQPEEGGRVSEPQPVFACGERYPATPLLRYSGNPATSP
ncbi:MAG: HNH endonuclease [Planctomycetota bacterium]